MKDIPEQKQAEQALRQSEQHYHSLVDALDVSLCRWLPDTTLTYANERYRKIFGVEGDGVGQKWLNFLPEEARASTSAFYVNVAEHPRTITYEHPVTVEDGSVREYQWIDTPILDEYGNVIEFQSVGIDITERKRAEEFVALNEAQVRGLLNATPDAMLIINAAGEIVMANARTESMIGYAQSELIGSLVEQLSPALISDFNSENSADFMANPYMITTGVGRVIYVLRKDGSQFPAEISLSHHTMLDGATVVLCSIRDVTERIYANTLIAAQRDLARLTSAGLSKEEVWKACFQIALFVSGLDCGGVYLFNKEERALELLHHEGLGAEFAHEVTRFIEDTPNTQSILSGKTVFLADSDLNIYTRNRAEGLRSLVAIPIHHHGEALGCLNIGSHHLVSIPDLARNALEALSN